MAPTSRKRTDTASRGARPTHRAAPSEKQTKKQIAISRRQSRQNRIIWLCVAGVGLLILIILVFALVQELVLKPSQPVARVNGTEIPATTFQDLLKYRRYNDHVSILSLQNGLDGLDPSDEANQFLISFYEQQLEQLQADLALAPDNALEELIEDALIQEKAEESGLTVTDEEVSGTIDADLERAAAPPPQTPVTDTADVLTPTAVPQEQLDELYQSALNRMDLSDKALRAIIKRSLYRSKLEDLLASQVVTTGLVARVQLIQTETAEAAGTARQRIEQGEDFAVVAQEVSTDTLTAQDGGDVGWVTIGQLSSRYGEKLETEVFAASVAELKIVESDGRFHLFRVTERDENGPLPADVLSLRQRSALSDWLAEAKASADVLIERLLQPDQIPPDPLAGQ